MPPKSYSCLAVILAQVGQISKWKKVVVLYRRTDTNAWSKVDLAFDPKSGWATGGVDMAPTPIEYFVQAADPTGNVSLELDHGHTFNRARSDTAIFLAFIRR